MIFSSLTFLVFFALVLALYAALKGDQARRRVLLLGSYVFYGWWDWRFLFLMAGSSLWSWWWGNRLHPLPDGKRRSRLLVVALCGDLGALAFFKYANFFIESFCVAFDVRSAGALNIILPVGISFFTFQSMSYTIDLWRRRLEPCHDAEKFLLFVSFFPQLVAGPIVRAQEFLPQLERRITTTRRDISIGAQQFLLGLVQKIVVADNLSFYVDPVFATPSAYDTATLWGAIAAYTLQIFCDFSGYSLMAIGVARVLGFRLPDNFRTPYLAASITDFWRRWHMSLSFWLRDYLYISLGGNRKGRTRTDVNLLLTMLLGGLWHGAGWNFVLWGGMHGLGLLVHKHWRRATGERRPPGYGVLAWATTLLFVVLLWVPFRCATWAHTADFVAGLFSTGPGIRWLHSPSLLLIGAMAAWHVIYLRPDSRLARALPSEDPGGWPALWLTGLLLLAVLMFAPFQASPFIYFQF